MKKNIIIAILASVLLGISQIASAVPAQPGLITYTQPDGSKISIRIYGDEWFHYMTDESGNILEENSAGYLVKSSVTMSMLKTKMANAQAEREMMFETRPASVIKAQAKGSPKIPVLLVQFQDKSFSISDPKTAFNNLLNQIGYSENEATGSVADYYRDQSRGVYTPQFEVLDIVTVKDSMSTYGNYDNNAYKAVNEACQLLDSSVDFSRYDNDGDGKIDMILMYFAGYNQAEGAPEETIWPHSSVISNNNVFDGVKLGRYFCTSELKGTSGTNMCRIGTTCHEFAHALGLPDFYDTNYDYYGDGQCYANGKYDLMCSGSYNNYSRTPPWMNAEELMMLGWMDEIKELAAEGEIIVPSIDAATPVAYKTPATDDGEYFLYECRPGTGWDAPLKGGLLIYHVDKSPDHKITWNKSSSSTNTQTACELWANWSKYNAINCNGKHPCFYIIPSRSQSDLNYISMYYNYPFPGYGNITSYTPKDWSGNNTGFSLTDITFDSASKTVTFNLSNSNDCSITGIVMDSDDNPLSGVTVSASKSVFSISATTDLAGSYTLAVDEPGDYVITASKSGYALKSVTIAVNKSVKRDICLLREGEIAPSEIVTYPDNASWADYGYSFGYGQLMCADIFPSSIMSQHAGRQIKEISFQIAGKETTTGDVYALIDFGSERKLALKVDNPVFNDWTTVDVSSQKLIIPDGKDIYAGYAYNSLYYLFPLVATKDTKSPDLIGYVSSFDLASIAWEPYTLLFKVKLKIGDYVEPSIGYSYIDNPKSGTYGVGDVFDLKLVETSSDNKPDSKGVTWFYDDEPVKSSVILNVVGTHMVRAEFITVSGDKMVVELEITVNQ